MEIIGMLLMLLVIIVLLLIIRSGKVAIREIKDSLHQIKEGDMMKELPKNLKGDYQEVANEMNEILLENKKLMGNILASSEKTKVYVQSLLRNC